MPLKYKTYKLNEATVEGISAEIQAYLNTQGMERRNIQRLRLTVEEILLNLLSKLPPDKQIRVGLGKQLGRHHFRMRYDGAPFNPTKAGENPWTDDLLRTLGYNPVWSYRGQTNTISLVLKERVQRSTVFNIGIAVGAAVLLGLCGNFIPLSVRQGLDEALLGPIAQGFLGLMSTFSGLLIAFTICSGILGVGDSVTLEQMGKRIVFRFVGSMFVVCAATVGLMLPFLKLNYSGLSTGQDSQINQVSKLFFDILPSNPVEPFQTGNSLQIIVIALFIGIGLLAIGDRGSHLCTLVEEATALMQRTVSAICASLIPLFVLTMLLRQFWFGDAQMLVSIWKPLVLCITALVMLTVAFWLISSLRLRCPPMLLMKKVLPPSLVAFTTASSMSALTLSMETCEKKLGASKSTVAFAFPLGTVIFMPGAVIQFAVITCTFAEIYGVNVSPGWLILAIVTVTLLIIAMPPIPGARVMVYTILFARMGIPAETLVLATALELVMEYCSTGVNVLLLIMQVACEAKSFYSLDQDILLDRLGADSNYEYEVDAVTGAIGDTDIERISAS